MKFESADFVWDGDLDHPHIINLSITLLRDQVIAIVGDVGSGKSLLAAIMGQLKRTNGTIKSNGAVCGYVPEEPWFINATLRDNIMFGLDPDEKRYSDAIRISGLTRDIMLLSNGDDTYINDLNLSPSQKQRISLARCIYLNPDIILMEDCLSDFDHTQSKQLFKECIKNQLSKNRCIIMLTQQKQFLSDFDHILVLKGGKVVEQGSYVDLKAKNVNFSAWVTDMVQLEDDPTGLFDNTTEIKLDPSTSTTSPTPISPLKPVSNNFCHLQIRKRTSKPRSSPLASAKPINANADTTNSTIRQLMELNSSSMQTSQLNEHTISKMIERSQNSILTGNSMRPPANFANQDVVSRTIEANHLTVHSLHDFDVGTLEPGNSDANSSPYIQFLREKPGLVLSVFFLAIFLLAHGFRFFSDVWLKHLVDELPNGFNVNLMVQWILTGIIAFSILIRGVGFSYMILRKAASVLRAPMSFFDVTPLGHILSFFARHLYSIDETLPDTALQVLTFLPLVLGTIVMACAYIPWLWVTVPIYLVGWFLIIVACVSVQNLFLQLETNNKSPMFAHLSTTLEGLFSIRLYHAESRFDYFNRTLIDADHKALYSLLLVKTLTSVCLDSVSSFFIYVTALFCVLFPVSASDTGIAITNILQLLLFVPWLVKMFFEMHGSMTSVSSLIYFGDHVPRETRSKNVIVPPKEWPTDGQIVFKDVTSKYHRYGVSVLKGVTFHIEPREKIAILGRSVSILRIIEPSEGHMFIDGVDLSSISLKSLRSRIAIIPQEPVMLTGTIRTNLDPFGISTDEEIWDALKMVHLADKIEEMPNKLETAIAENGRKFNIPERQLFCIARAVLIRTKIIIYDEPSVIVDRDTERLIQQVMTENFADCTVIVLATRFRVIVQMDRVMVMKHGQIVEFDTPLALLDNPKSKFSLMLSQTAGENPFSSALNEDFGRLNSQEYERVDTDIVLDSIAPGTKESKAPYNSCTDINTFSEAVQSDASSIAEDNLIESIDNLHVQNIQQSKHDKSKGNSNKRTLTAADVERSMKALGVKLATLKQIAQPTCFDTSTPEFSDELSDFRNIKKLHYNLTMMIDDYDEVADCFNWLNEEKLHRYYEKSLQRALHRQKKDLTEHYESVNGIMGNFRK
ncbi:Multidrug resistance-associated protein 4 [Globomyces sp. JEL0801]|nr:Multidrug resistance-associated protein 4 [Globomyces sp. JEL0801]